MTAPILTPGQHAAQPSLSIVDVAIAVLPSFREKSTWLGLLHTLWLAVEIAVSIAVGAAGMAASVWLVVVAGWVIGLLIIAVVAFAAFVVWAALVARGGA